MGVGVRRIADAGRGTCDQTQSVLSATTPTPTRTERLWSEEVARVLAAAPAFEPAVRRAVRATLDALARDPSTDEATRADVAAMLDGIAAT